MQRMIRQFAAEYTSKTSSTQDSSSPNSTKNQSLLKASPVASSTAGARAQNPVLSKLLMADQDSPLDLTVRKSQLDPSEQDGVLDLSTKKSPCAGNASLSHSPGCSATPGNGRPGRPSQHHAEGLRSGDGVPPRSWQDGTREGSGHSTSLKVPLARSLQISEELLSRNQHATAASHGPSGLQNHGQHMILSREASWAKPHYEFNFTRMKFRGNGALHNISDLPFLTENSAFQKMALQTKQDGKKDMSHSTPVDLKIPQVRGMDLSWESRSGDQYSYSSLVMGSQTESALSKKLRAILPKQNRRSLLDPGPDSWGSDAEQSTSGQPYSTSDQEGDPGSKQPRKKRGRYRQYNSEILEEAISVVMNGKMSVSKAQSIYGIPHSTLEYKVKERLGTLKNPPKKKMKLMRSEGQDVSVKLEIDPQGEAAHSANESKDDSLSKAFWICSFTELDLMVLQVERQLIIAVQKIDRTPFCFAQPKEVMGFICKMTLSTVHEALEQPYFLKRSLFLKRKEKEKKNEETAQAVAIDSLGQPKSPLEKIMVRLCEYHQKHFVRVLNDICTEVQTGYEGQQLSGPENLDVPTCSSGCSQYHIENQEHGTSCSESKLPLLLDAEQSEARGSLRILCHALKHAVELKSTDRRENCSSVRRDFPELPTIRTTSISPRDSPTQGYLTASNTHHSIKNLEGQTSAIEQETGTRKGEDDKDQVQSRGLLGGYVAVKATNVNINEENLENRVSSLKNPFKAFPEETRETAFTTSSPRRADKENALQCGSKAFMHQDTEINDQETRSKVENHYLASGKSKGVCHMHPGDKTHVENAKDIWLPINSMPAVHHKTTNGHSRVKSISASTKSTRKSKKSSGLRINDYDNQYDVVYISQPITECHYESKKTVSARKTARKSTRGYYYNGECCELPTIRTLVKTPHSQENGNILATRPEALTSPIQGISLPSDSYLAAAEPVGSNDDQRSSTVAPTQEDSFSEIRTEQCSYESISSEVSVLKQKEASLAEQATMPVSLFPCPVFHSDKDSLFVSSLQTMTVSFPQEDKGDLQDSTDILEAHSFGSDSYNCNRSKENSVSIANSVVHPVSEAANDKSAPLFSGNVTIPEPPILIEPESHVSMDLLMPEVSANSMDLLPPLDEPASVIDVSPSIEPPLLSPIDLAEPSVIPPALDALDPCMTFPSEIPYISNSVSPVQLVASPRSMSPVNHPTGRVPELPTHIDREPSEILSEESSVVATIKMNVELPQLLSNLEAAKLPLSLDCTNTHETTIENSQNLKERLSVECKNVLPLVAGSEDKGEKNVNDTINISETIKSDEEMEVNSETPVDPKTSDKDKKETSSKTNIDKKRRREKKPHIVSDRCLRSQQSLAPTEDSSEQPCSSNSLQFPQLQIKLSKSPGAKRFKREVHLDGATSVCLPNDRHHQTLLNDSSKSTEQQADDENDITIRQTYKKVMAKESVIERSENGEENKDKPAAMLEICLEANSDKRSVHVPTEISDKTEKQIDLKPESLENSDGPMNIIEELSNQHETSSFICPGSKHAQPEKAMKCKKPALQFYNLRHTPTTGHVVTATRNTSEKAIVQVNSDIMTTSADPVVTDEPNARNENSIDFNSMKVLSDKPRFVEWCAEEDNQELITNFNTQYMKIQKGWIQLEKEAQPAPKVKNKSDKLKEIWKSKKRTRKFKGSTEVQKLSPVQMLFMKGFDISNICKWFMETTETKSLVIVKKLNTRIPGDMPLMKLPLQKGCSSGVYPSSLQAERLKKHLKKFAAMTPAKNTIKIQKLWTRLRENGDQTESEQIVGPKQTSLSEGSLAQCIGPKNIQPSPSMPVQTSSRILRKYSNLRGKLHGFHRAVKQERHDCMAKQLLAESSSSNKSMCIKPLMSPKLAQQVKAIQLPTKSTPIEKGGKGRKGKGKLQEDTSAKGSLQQSKKKTPNENIRTLAVRQLSPSSKERISLKKVSKVKQVGAPATRKQTAAGRNNKHTSQNEKSKKLIDSRPGKKKAPTHIGKASTSQKASLLSKQQGLMKALKEKVVRDPPSQSLKKASSEKALTRSVKRIQENKTRSKRKLRAKKESSPSKRRRLDAK
ncbi:ligand-dependent corepressor [Ahaetulla prasina]|nr:ligand-dependent corepressor [Ahaetulla prasina]